MNLKINKSLSIYMLNLWLASGILSCAGIKDPITGIHDWKTADMKSVGIDPDIVARARKQIRNGKYEGLRSLVIIKNGMLVHEAYFEGYTRSHRHRIFSISKSVTSLLVGIAIDKGFIEGVEETLFDLLPQYSDILKDESKQRITLKDVLTMSPGLEWHEEDYPYRDNRNSHTQMNRKRDWLQFVLSRPMAFTAGTRWVYSTGHTHILAGIIKTKTGMHADVFAEKYLFGPLHIEGYDWNKDATGHPCVGGSNGGLRLKTRDLAKIGQLLLNKGRWQGKQVVSQAWINESTDIHINATNISQYGYQWWRDKYTIKGKELSAICGYGYGGQSLHIFPELQMVVVMTSWGRLPRAQTLPVLLKILHAAIR